jgi:serine/threonine protein kinase
MPIAHNLPTTFGKYKIEKILGEGSTCVVAQAVDQRTGNSYAVKIVDLKEDISSRLTTSVEREIRILKRLNHPNIIKLIEVVRINGKVFIVMEHCEGGTLLNLILSEKLNDESEVKRLFSQIAEGISYLHKHGISHGDIKPDNIVLTADGEAKLIDFGYSKESFIGFDCDKSGTVKYSAPELLRSGVYDTRKADSWSLGILLFVMATGRFPYSSSDDSIVRRLISSGQLARIEQFGSDLSELYDILTHFSPRRRLTADEIANFPCLSIEQRKDDQKHQITLNLEVLKTRSENEMDGLIPF